MRKASHSEIISRTPKTLGEPAIKILKLHENGMCVMEIANKLGVSKFTIYKVYKKNNIKKIGKKYQSGLTPEQAGEILRLTNLGFNRLKVSKILNLAESKIRWFRKCENIKNPHFVAPSNQETIDEIIKYKLLGLKSIEIAKLTGLHKCTVNRICRKNIPKQNQSIQEVENSNQLKKIRKNFSNTIHRALKKNGNKNKYHSISGYLPYNVKKLKRHIEKQFEPWMNWDNWGAYRLQFWNDNDQSTWVWQIDHIIPASEFKYKSMSDDEFTKCWALENLRPLNAKQNIIDGARKLRHKLKIDLVR